MTSITFYNAEELADFLDEAYTYKDKDNAIAVIPFIDDWETFWLPFAKRVFDQRKKDDILDAS